MENCEFSLLSIESDQSTKSKLNIEDLIWNTS